MLIQRLDHLVLTVEDIETSVKFYTSVLGMKEITFKVKHKETFKNLFFPMYI